MSPEMPHLAALLTRRRGAVRGGGTRAGLAGIPAVTVASSAYVREANVWPIRASNSSLVSRPCANAAWSVSATRSRSASDARM
jgi:hypothetical protein